MDEGPPARRSLQSQTVFALGQKQTFAPQKVMSAYPQKRTLQWDTRGKKPNDPLEGFSVPLFCKPLIRLRWCSPLGTTQKLLRTLISLHFCGEIVPLSKVDSHLVYFATIM